MAGGSLTEGSLAEDSLAGGPLAEGSLAEAEGSLAEGSLAEGSAPRVLPERTCRSHRQGNSRDIYITKHTPLCPSS